MAVRQIKPLLLLGLFLTLLLCAQSVATAQEEESPGVAGLTVTSINADRLPSIELTVYGRDAQGNPLDFTTTTLTIQHGGSNVGPIEYLGPHTVGSFTLFLIDIPPGVANQLTALQDAILQYASPGNMTEQIDAVAVYQVGASGAEELLAPTNFHNDVRNLFDSSLQPETGATALYDSTGRLLEDIEGLKPNPAMAASIVLMTDGTDTVSRQFEGDDIVDLARQLGIPIHTVHLINQNIGNPDIGRNFLTDLAADTGGIAVTMANNQALPQVWTRIGGFRNQSRISYLASNLTAGETQVAISLTDNPAITAVTTINIPASIPSIELLLAAENRTLALPELPTPEDPLPLRFRSSVSWLDEVEREISAATLIINGDQSISYDVPIDSVADFVAEISNLTYGNNTVEISVIDDQGLLVTSPILILTVDEGPRQIPEELAASSVFVSTLLRVALILGIVAVLLVGAYVIWRTGGLPRTMPNLGEMIPRGPSRRVQRKVRPAEDARYIPTHTVGYLEILASETELSSPVPLSSAMVRMGRSPGQCDIPFEQDITMSRLHANLMLEGNNYRIFDENSTSGTFVNDRQVPEYGIQLMDGDEIHMGAVHLRFRQA